MFLLIPEKCLKFCFLERRRFGVFLVPYYLRPFFVCEMDSPAAGHRVTAQILRLNNGVEHVLLQNNQGAIARV